MHQESHLANRARRNLDLTKVTQEVQQPSWGNFIFDISLQPWHLCKKWMRFFFLCLFWRKTSLTFSKFIFSCSETQFEEKSSLLYDEWMFPWNDFSTNDGDLMFDDMKWPHTFCFPLCVLCTDISDPIANPSSVGEEISVWGFMVKIWEKWELGIGD